MSDLIPEWKFRVATAARKLSKIIDDNNASPGDRKFAEAAFEALLWALGSSGHDRMDQLLEDA